MKKKEKEEETLPYLPHELVIQILLRLPVKSLIRFKCICKSWFSLISDPHFANSQFQLTVATPTRRVVYINNHEARSIDLETSITASVLRNHTFLLQEPYFHFEIKGECRGFILLHFPSNIYLWNPSTGLHKQIPFYPIDSGLYLNYFCGVGYDKSRDDYLVVSIFGYRQSGDVSSRLYSFSLRDNKWKTIEGIHLPYKNVDEDEMPRAGLFYNTAVHWLAFNDDLTKVFIVAFDLMEMKLFEMSLPDDIYRNPRYCDLWVFGEFLSVWAIDEFNTTIEIWVMNEYTVHSSWTKTLVLLIDDDIPMEDFIPLCSTKSGDIIVTDRGTGFLKYNDKGQLLEHNSFYNYGRGSTFAFHTESLLSLPGASEQALEDDLDKKNNEVVKHSPSPFS